jgi:urease accessory protein UreE
MAVTERVIALDEEIELIFKNVKIKDIEFYDQNEVEVDFSKSDDVKVTKEKNVIRISSDDYAKVSLHLPETKNYIYKTEDAVVKFNVQIVTIETDDGDLIEFKDGSMTVIEDNGSQIVEIGPEGIFVTDDDEIVEISSRGIIVETEDEDKHLTGFWGRLLGGFVKLIAKSSISVVSKDPGRMKMMVKLLVLILILVIMMRMVPSLPVSFMILSNLKKVQI